MKFACIYFCLTFIFLTKALANNRKCTNVMHKKSNSKAVEDTLVLTSVVFRHGDRVTDVHTNYPNNPYKNVSIFPYNAGDLKLDGQKTMLAKGRQLRKRYNNFLGDMYYHNLVESVSSCFTRCQMSLQALHTGLFGGLKDVPIKKLKWQAVPYKIIPPDEDNTISFFLTCPSIGSNVEFPSHDNAAPEFKAVWKTLEDFSGLEEVGYREASTIYDFIKTSTERGLEVPADFIDIYPEPLRTISMEEWNIFSRQTIGMTGPLMKVITDHALAKANGTLEPKDRKMFLYAGHNLSIIYLMQALNVWNNEEVLYGAHLMFELHNIEGTFGFKVYFQNNYLEPRLLEIEGCDTLCPLSMFAELADDLIANDLICD